MDNRDAMKTLPLGETLRKVEYSYEWINTWRYVIVQPSVKCVGMAAASFANADGTRVRPGVRRLMTITGYSNRAVCDALTTLRWLGFLWRSKVGTRTPEGGQADEHWLCIPKDMSHIPIADFDSGLEPAFDDLAPEAQEVAVILEVDKRLRKVSSELSSKPSELSSRPSEPTPPDRVKPVHNTNPPTNPVVTNSYDHSAFQQAGARASSRADEDPDGYDIVDEAVGGLDPVESSTTEGMLADGYHPNAVANRILQRRDAA